MFRINAQRGRQMFRILVQKKGFRLFLGILQIADDIGYTVK